MMQKISCAICEVCLDQPSKRPILRQKKNPHLKTFPSSKNSPSYTKNPNSPKTNKRKRKKNPSTKNTTTKAPRNSNTISPTTIINKSILNIPNPKPTILSDTPHPQENSTSVYRPSPPPTSPPRASPPQSQCRPSHRTK